MDSCFDLAGTEREGREGSGMEEPGRVEGKGLMNIAFVGMSTGLQFSLGNDYMLVSLLCLLKV